MRSNFKILRLIGAFMLLVVGWELLHRHDPSPRKIRASINKIWNTSEAEKERLDSQYKQFGTNTVPVLCDFILHSFPSKFEALELGLLKKLHLVDQFKEPESWVTACAASHALTVRFNHPTTIPGVVPDILCYALEEETNTDKLIFATMAIGCLKDQARTRDRCIANLKRLQPSNDPRLQASASNALMALR